MTERKMVPQLATSVESDFGERTWTFKLGDEMLVSAGEFYIVPQGEFEEMLRLLEMYNRAAIDRLHP